MTSQITAPAPIQRFMAALSTAEHVTATAPVTPEAVNVQPLSEWGYVPDTFEWRIGVLVSYSERAQVQQFAEVLHVDLTERPFDSSRTYVYADGVLNEVPFRAWALVDAEASAVAA